MIISYNSTNLENQVTQLSTENNIFFFFLKYWLLYWEKFSQGVIFANFTNFPPIREMKSSRKKTFSGIHEIKPLRNEAINSLNAKLCL